jgi:tetratricopeptide (TPR) repeat protein
MLSRAAGPERFVAALRGIARQYAFRAVTWEEYLRALESGTGQDLSLFFAQWFDRTGAPDWRLSWRQHHGTLEGLVTQVAPHYRAAVEVRASGAQGQCAVRTVQVRGGRTEFSWDVGFPVSSVDLDPDSRVLRWTDEQRAEASALAPHFLANRERERGRLARAAALYEAALEKVPPLDLHGGRFILEFGLARVYADRKKLAEARAHLDAALASPTRRADTLPWAYYGYALVAKALNDEKLLHWAIDAAASADALAPKPTGAPAMARDLLPTAQPGP